MAKGFWDKEELITTVTKNKSENIQVKYCEKNEKSYIDIRIVIHDSDGEYRPTSKGIAIPQESLEEIIEKIQEYKAK